MDFRNKTVPLPGRNASRWLLFLGFYHLLPMIWFMGVAGGLAPGSFLLAGGIASLFAGDSDGFAMAAFLLVPALVGGLLYYGVAWLFMWLIGKLQRPLARTLCQTGLLAISLITAMQPIFISGGHSSSYAYNLLGFSEVLQQFRVPPGLIIGYFSLLVLLLLALLSYQQLVSHHQAISIERWRQRRRLRRRLLLAGILLLLVSLGWTHHTLLFVKPLADLGFASAQYRLAMTIKEDSIARYDRSGQSYQFWLVKAAEQGHKHAAEELVLHPRNREEKLRWLTVAADAGMAGAQYQLYRELLNAAPQVESDRGAFDWLQRAADNDQAEAQYELGRAYLHGQPRFGVKKNQSLARHWLEQATDNGYGPAMKELVWRYRKGADGFPRDAQRAIELYQQLAAGYQTGDNGLKQNQPQATHQLEQAEQLAKLQSSLEQGDPQAQALLAHELLQVANGSAETRAQGVALLEKAAEQGDAQLQYELGGIFLNGRHQQPVDLPRGRNWWARALAQNHVPTMESVAPAYQSGRFGYQVDLLQSKVLVTKLVEAYRDGNAQVDPDPHKEQRWSDELKYFDRLFELAGGDYQSPVDLQRKAEAGDPQAMYQLGRQQLVSGPPAQRRQGIYWIEQAAQKGNAEAQYRLVTTYERQAGIMRNDPLRGVAILTAAARQNHLPAMGTLALGYEKGRFGLKKDYHKAKEWYQRLLQAYDKGKYLGEINQRFIPFNRQRLVYASKALETEQAKARRYEAASPLERQVIAIKERYRIRYQDAVNALPRGNGTREAKLQFRTKIQRLRKRYNQQRDAEISRLKEGTPPSGKDIR